jgi:hypothetical protein
MDIDDRTGEDEVESIGGQVVDLGKLTTARQKISIEQGD